MHISFPFFKILNSYFADFILKLDQELHLVYWEKIQFMFRKFFYAL